MTPLAHRRGLSRRVVCASGVGLAALTYAPPSTFANSSPRQGATERDLGSALDLRGVRIGGHAVLRLSGTVTAGDGLAWRFEDNTQVQWCEGNNYTVIEQRRGRLHLTPMGGGKLIELSTGPVNEILPIAAEGYALARQRGVDSLVMAAQPLAISDVWAITDDPMVAALPTDVSEFRVFRHAGAEQRRVFSAMRSPWLPALGANEQAPALTWRASGTLTTWRDESVVGTV